MKILFRFTDSEAEVSSDESIDELDLSASFFNISDEESDDEQTPTMHGSSQSQENLLYSGAPAGLTEYMAHVLLFQYSVRHSLTGKALQELLHLLGVFLPRDAEIPKSVRHLKQFFLKTYKEQCPAMQKYCTFCQRLLRDDETCTCNAGCSEFVTVPIGPQLKARFQGKWVVISCILQWIVLNLLFLLFSAKEGEGLDQKLGTQLTSELANHSTQNNV